jgi:hypothetical protein
MQWTIVWSGPRALSRAIIRANGQERERETRRLHRSPAPVEMRGQQFADGSRFDRCPGSRRGRHSRAWVYREIRAISEGQEDSQSQAER